MRGFYTRQLDRILRQQEKTMSALSDLQTAVAGVASALAVEIKAVADALAAAAAGNAGSVAPADVEAQVAALNVIAGQLASETASLAPAPTSGS